MEIRYDLKDVLNIAEGKVKNIGHRIAIGNAGYVELLDYMGSDTSIVESARQSYNMGTAELTPEKVKNMIVSMTKNGHTSPFEQAIVKFRFKMPIFVARQFLRHRTASLNEASLRYTKSNCEFYLPSYHTFDMRKDLGPAFGDLSKEDIEEIGLFIENQCNYSAEKYIDLVNRRREEDDTLKVPKEIARTVLSLGTYTEFVWSMDLNNLKHLLKLRMDNHAQREIFEYAVAMYMLTWPEFPETMDAFTEYDLYTEPVSLTDMDDPNKINLYRQRLNIKKHAIQNEIAYLTPRTDDSYVPAKITERSEEKHKDD